MNPIRKRIIPWIFIALSMTLLVVIWKSSPSKEELLDGEEAIENVKFYYDDEFDYYTSLFQVSDDTYYVYLPSFADISRIKVVSANYRIDFEQSDELFSVYEKKKEVCSFSPEVEYDVKFYDSDENEIAEINIVFMQSANLPTVYISTTSGSFEQIDADKTYKEDAVFSLVTVDGYTACSNVFAEISARGNHTFTFEKKSYQFDLSNAKNLLEMGNSETWILLCNSYDYSNMRNKITYDMAVNLGMEGSPSAEFVDVYFNNIYHGTYLLSEKVEYGENRLDYDDIETKNRLVNEKRLSEYETFSESDGVKKGYLLPNSPRDISGGYLIEHDYGVKYDGEDSGFITTGNERYAVINPKHATPDEIEYISNLFQEIEDAIKSDDGYNKKTGKHYSEYIDMKSWVRKYIVEEFSKNHGGGCTSSYFYKLPDNVSGKVYGGPVWDYDKAYGRNGGMSSLTHDLNFMTLHSSYTEFFYYLYKHEDFRELVYSEYENVFLPYIENEIIPQINYYEPLLEPALKMNFHRFKIMFEEDIEFNTASYHDDVEYLRQFIWNRKEALNRIWIDKEDICYVHFADTQQQLRSTAFIKGEPLQIIPNHWERESGKDYVWVDSETGEQLEYGMIVDRDIVGFTTEIVE